jgi:hypothetical protein
MNKTLKNISRIWSYGIRIIASLIAIYAVWYFYQEGIHWWEWIFVGIVVLAVLISSFNYFRGNNLWKEEYKKQLEETGDLQLRNFSLKQEIDKLNELVNIQEEQLKFQDVLIDENRTSTEEDQSDCGERPRCDDDHGNQ